MEELAEEEMLKKIEEVEKGGFEGDVYPDSDDEEADEKRTSSAGLGHHTVQCVPDEGEHRAAHEGLHLFFTNRFEEADAFFQQRQETNPLHSTCYGMVGFIRAIFTFEPDQIQEARKRLAVAHQLAKKHAGYDSTLGSLAKMVSFRKAKPLTQEQLSSRLNVAETKLIDSVLVCLGENVSSLVQGGLGAKWAWHRYDELVSQVHSSDPRSTGQVAVCASDLGGIYYGFGVFNLLLSILPRRVVRLVQLLGFKADRDVGLESLNKVNDLAREHGGGMRAPMASLMLLGYHVMASAFFTVPEELPTHIRLATAILDEEFKRFPDSALFLFNQGRLDRLKGDGTAAVRSFERCMEVNSEWSQLKHLCHYELGWGTMAQGKWGVSRGERVSAARRCSARIPMTALSALSQSTGRFWKERAGGVQLSMST
uniref:Tetratricopeptide repeat protein 39B n=1 Tax=Hemiselmis tepida TaxID=464990 RepID=A0A7S0VZX4_9CRYP